jgi:hypothetical protein
MARLAAMLDGAAIVTRARSSRDALDPAAPRETG